MCEKLRENDDICETINHPDSDVFPNRSTKSGNKCVNGRDADNMEELPLHSPNIRYRHRSGSTSPTRTPSPSRDNTIAGDLPAVRVKSVSFHSHTNWKNDRRIHNAQDCLQYMMEGSSMIKLRSGGRQYHRYFRLLEDLSAITWTPSSKKSSRAQVHIDKIKEVSTGRNKDNLRHKAFPVGYNEERIFTIFYGDAYESLDLIAFSPEEANIWVTGLKALIGAFHSPDLAEDSATFRESWLRTKFLEASKDHEGCIDQATCIQLVRSLDDQVASDKVRQKIQEIDHEKCEELRGKIELQEFIDMFKEIATRPEIYFLMIRFANKEYLTKDDLHLFLEGEQGMCGLTEEKVEEIIHKFEPSPDALRRSHLLVDGFTKYLLSEECEVFDPSQREVCQDMNQPLSHYFIAASHNTYLLEDQLKGPSSVDGYIRVLSCGCRCVKVDVWDGIEEPIVYKGNTATGRIFFKDVVESIGTFAFDYSIYPVFIHIENHCSIEQQKIMASQLKSLLGNSLYVHPKNSKFRLCDLTPFDLKYKIILKGKKLANEDRDGEVTDEDEGGETKRNNNPRKILLCRELSSLISLSRSRSLEFPALSEDSCDVMCSLSENSIGKLCHSMSDDIVNHNKSFITRVFPNCSRLDSSNYNPQDFWNVGCQMVALNFQTPGQMMDVYEGRFRANGSCGYVLKPSVMRDQISVYSAHSKDTIPGISPQVLKIKIISGQCLPKPSGSTATKASVIDPFVVIQVFGMPSDCSEAKTRTVSNNGSSPIFDQSFDFLINLPELALLRFVVLDDEYIGDDFVGQCTIPFDCLQTGYRHIRLLSSMGEPLSYATLFVHISITNKRGGKSHRGWGRKSQNRRINIKTLGVKVADDIFKESAPLICDAELRQEAVDSAWIDLQEECGLSRNANIKQCLKIIINRFTSHQDGHNLALVTEDKIPFLRSSNPEQLPSHLHKLLAALDRLLLELHQFLQDFELLKSSLADCLQPSLKLYDDLEHMIVTHGIKGKKANKCRENFAYNVRVIKGQLDRLDALEKKSKIAFEQMESTKSTLRGFSIRDRSPSLRDKAKLHFQNRHPTLDNLSSYGGLGRSPTSPVPADCKPKSILKKSNSNIESTTHGYITDIPSPDGCTTLGTPKQSLLKPPLHYSLSYTPGIEHVDRQFAITSDHLITDTKTDTSSTFTLQPKFSPYIGYSYSKQGGSGKKRCSPAFHCEDAISFTACNTDSDDPSTAL